MGGNLRSGEAELHTLIRDGFPITLQHNLEYKGKGPAASQVCKSTGLLRAQLDLVVHSSAVFTTHLIILRFFVQAHPSLYYSYLSSKSFICISSCNL